MNLRNKKLVRTIQILFGIYLIFFGVIGYIITPPAPQYNEAAVAFFTALFETGYILHVVSLIFVISGLTFIFNRGSAFGAVLLAPISFNILMFHIFLDNSGFWLALIPVILNIYLIGINWQRYKPMINK